MSPLPLLLLALCVLPTAAETFNEATVDKKLSTIWLKLEVHNRRLETLLEEHADIVNNRVVEVEEKVDQVLLDLDKAFAVIEILVELTNGTSQVNVLLQENIEILKGRLAIAAIFSSVYMIISTLWLIGQLAVLVKKSVKKHQLKRHEEEVELMDQRLQERRERRRAAARAKSGSPRQQ